MLISLVEYAKIHGRDPATVRQMALRGGFQTARKIGRNWVIEDYEEYPDHRKKENPDVNEEVVLCRQGLIPRRLFFTVR